MCSNQGGIILTGESFLWLLAYLSQRLLLLAVLLIDEIELAGTTNNFNLQIQTSDLKLIKYLHQSQTCAFKIIF